jgi:hypothetical protein
LSYVLPDRSLHIYKTHLLTISHWQFTTITTAAATTCGQDLEMGELRRRLKAEHSVRKACERWLKSELKSRVSAARQR